MGQDQTKSYTIREFSELFDVSYRTLRFYEERDLLRPRRAGYLRLYSESDKHRLATINKAKRLGFSLLEIWTLLDQRERGVERGEPTCGLGLTRDELRSHLEKLIRRRDGVVDAIQELRELLAKNSG